MCPCYTQTGSTKAVVSIMTATDFVIWHVRHTSTTKITVNDIDKQTGPYLLSDTMLGSRERGPVWRNSCCGWYCYRPPMSNQWWWDLVIDYVIICVHILDNMCATSNCDGRKVNRCVYSAETVGWWFPSQYFSRTHEYYSQLQQEIVNSVTTPYDPWQKTN